MFPHRNFALALAACLSFLESQHTPTRRPLSTPSSTDWQSTSTPESGNILKLAYPERERSSKPRPARRAFSGTMAYPLADFEPFRGLGSTYSTAAKVEQTPGAVAITWEKPRRKQGLPVSRQNLGRREAIGRSRGRSVTLQCTIRNQSSGPWQVLFPDLHGFLPALGQVGDENPQRRPRHGPLPRHQAAGRRRFYPDPGQRRLRSLLPKHLRGRKLIAGSISATCTAG